MIIAIRVIEGDFNCAQEQFSFLLGQYINRVQKKGVFLKKLFFYLTVKIGRFYIKIQLSQFSLK